MINKNKCPCNARDATLSSRRVRRVALLIAFAILHWLSPSTRAQQCPAGSALNTTPGPTHCGGGNFCQINSVLGEQWSITDVANLAHQHGFNGDGLVNAIAEAWAESQFHPFEVDNNVDATNFRVCLAGQSIDRGLWQVNDAFWKMQCDPVTCALVPGAEADFVSRLTGGGFNSSAWGKFWPATFGKAAYRSELPAACVAAAAVDPSFDPTKSQLCQQPQPPSSPPCVGPGCLSGIVIVSGDPNDKTGSQGVGPQQYVSGGTPLKYGILFGNEPTATAPTQTVVITDPLQTATMDLATLSLGPITFGGQVVLPTGGANYSTSVDLRPQTNLIVGITASLNSSNGTVIWKLSSLDPATGQPTTDPTAGLLPPGQNGSIFFTVLPLQGLSTGSQVQNQATVVFDVNAPINTPTWVNTLDNSPPTSHVGSLPATGFLASFPVSWAGSDIGAGIQDFTVYVSDGGGPFAIWQQDTSATSAVFAGQFGHAYSFYSIARDLVGNVEAAKSVAEATTQVLLDTTPPSINCGAPDGLWHSSDVSIPCTANDAESGLANPSDANFSLSTSVPVGTETSNATTGTRTVCDVARNCATAGPITGNMVDKKPPSINISSPTTGGSYLVNQAVNANYACTDGGSGVATCTGSVASGSPISTASVGSKTFAVNASDNVGNVAPLQLVSYSVTYALCLLYDPTRSVQGGSTIPLKLQLCDANNTDVSSSSVLVHAVSLVQTSTNSSETIQASGSANPDNDFRFDPTLGPTGGYIFNLSTKGFTTGSYQLTFTAGADPLPHALNFQVR